MTRWMLAAAVASMGFMAGVPGAADALELEEKVHGAYRQVGEAKEWKVIYSTSAGADRSAVCAIYARPDQSGIYENGEPVEALRGELAAFMSWNDQRPAAGRGELSFLVGAAVEEGPSEYHELKIGDDVSIPLVGIGDRLYVRPEDDRRAVAAVRAGVDMTVEGRLGDGRMIKDRYSLMGVMAATGLASGNCR